MSNDRENQHLATNELVKFEKEPVEVEDCRIVTDHFRVNYKIFPKLTLKGHMLS